MSVKADFGGRVQATVARVCEAATLDAMFANSSEAIVVVDDRGLVQYASPGAALLLGYDADAALGTSVFTYLHPDDVEAAARLFERRLDFDGTDLGHEMRLRSASGEWLQLLATAALLPDPEVGAVAITLRSVDVIDSVERSLRRRVAVQEYCNRLGAAFLEAHDGDEMHRCLRESLGEVGLLTGADVVDVHLERHERGTVERIARWTASGSAEVESDPENSAIDGSRFGGDLDMVFEECIHHDDLALATSGPLSDLLRSHGVFSFLSAPFSTSTQRGVVALSRVVPGPAWSNEDARLVRSVASLYGRALHTAQAEELLALTYRRGPLAISIRTWDGELVDCNDQYLELVGIRRADAAQVNFAEILHPDDRDCVQALMTELHQGRRDQLIHDTRILRPDGEVRWLRANAVTLHAPGSSEPYVLCALEDVTESHRQRVELEYAATHDSLTGVANRAAMVGTVERLVGKGESPTLLVVDLDRFKLVNDSLGHVAGDRILREVAVRLRREVRDADLVARLGGDEFAVVVPGLAPALARDLADRIRLSIESPIRVDGRLTAQTVSIGVALPELGSSGEDLLVHADRALYAAKAKGRNRCVVFDESMRDEVLARLDTERELRQAMDRGELEVHFQPEFDIRNRRILGAEALLRWVHPERGLVPADQFIEIAEQSGMIDDLGRFALREACRLFAGACDGPGARDLMLRVNISAREFSRPELPDIVRGALADASLDPARLCLEMTETTLMDSPEVALGTFERLHEVGVQFAIDDFGTGYSSLTYLKRFPVDALKIDRGFVADLEADDDSREIVGSIIKLASALSLEVVGEGVETERQLELLLGLGCVRAQGYLVSGALSADDLGALLRE